MADSRLQPGWVDTLLDVVPLPFLAPSAAVVKWLKTSENLFYAWHWYGSFWGHVRASLHATSRHATGAVCDMLMLSDADWRLQSDVVTNLRLQVRSAKPGRRDQERAGHHEGLEHAELCDRDHGLRHLERLQRRWHLALVLVR